MKLVVTADHGRILGLFDGEPENIPGILYLDPPDGFSPDQADSWIWTNGTWVIDQKSALNKKAPRHRSASHKRVES